MKIRDAQKEWIPYIAVIGEKEVQSGKLSVTIRESGEKKDLSLEKLISMAEKHNADKPFERLSLPPQLSKRPTV